MFIFASLSSTDSLILLLKFLKLSSNSRCLLSQPLFIYARSNLFWYSQTYYQLANSYVWSQISEVYFTPHFPSRLYSNLHKSLTVWPSSDLFHLPTVLFLPPFVLYFVTKLPILILPLKLFLKRWSGRSFQRHQSNNVIKSIPYTCTLA